MKLVKNRARLDGIEVMLLMSLKFKQLNKCYKYIISLDF